MKQIEIEEKRAKDQARLRLEQAYEIQKLLEWQKIDFTLKGKNGKIFWGINEHDVITRIAQKWKIDFEKQDVRLPNKSHIKTVGSHLVYLHITRDTIAKILIEVTLEA